MSLARVPQLLRVMLGLVVGIVALMLVLAAGLWWWAGTEGSLDWTLRRITRGQPVTLEGVSGSLRGGLRVQRVLWEDQGLRVEARGVHLEWRPQSLVTRTVHLRELQAESIEVRDERAVTGEPLRVPDTLRLPVRVVVDSFEAARLQYVHGFTVQLDGVAGRYAFDGLGHELAVDRLGWQKGRYSGRIKVGALGDMQVDAQLRGALQAVVPQAKEPLPLEFTAQASGPLRALDVHAVLDARTDAKNAPHAEVTARVTPFEAQPLPQASAVLQRVDVGAVWDAAPSTSLGGRVDVKPAGTATWAISADLENAAEGRWDEGRLPVRKLRARGEWRNGAAFVRELLAQVGGGEVQARGDWKAGAWTLDAQVQQVDPSAVHGMLAPMTVSGQAQARQHGKAIDFDVDLQGRPKAARAAPRKKDADGVAQAIATLQLQQLLAKGQWNEGTISVAQLHARASDALLVGSGSAHVESRSGRGKLDLTAPGLKASVDSEIAATRGGGKLQLQASDLAAAQQWLRRWPGVPASLTGSPLAGQGHAVLAWQGGWNDPAVQAALTASALQWGKGEQAWTVRDAVGTVNGRLRDAQIQLRGQARQGSRTLEMTLDARGGREGERWHAAVSQLKASLQDAALGAGERSWQLQALRPFDVRWDKGVLQASAGEASLAAPLAGGGSAPARIAWGPVRFGGGELQTSGRVSGLPMSWLALVGGQQLAGNALSGDLVFDGQWDAVVGRTIKVDATLRRVSGDIDVLAEDAEGAGRRVRAGVREASVRVQSQGERIVLTARWDSERAGSAQAQIASRLVPAGGGYTWPEQAPLEGRVRAEMPRIGIWSLLAPPGWRLRGSVHADVGVGGTRAQPLLNGTLAADDLALRSVVDGVELRDGRMRLRLEGERVRIDEFMLHGGGEGGGTLTARGEGRWTTKGPELTADVRMDKLRASLRSDRRLTVSGQLDARVAPEGSTIGGDLRVDEALIVVPEESAPRLGEDVVVRNAPGQIATADERKRRPPAQEAGAAPKEKPLKVSVRIGLGDAFRVRGRGIDTRLAGGVEVTADSLRDPRLSGTVRAVGGEYRAYGQRLDIERGIIRFTGAPDNPAIDILAVRPHMEQRVGVLVTGRAQSAIVRLYSEPDLPDAEKLTLLVTGQPTPSSGAEAALVQQAAMALLASRGGAAGSGGIAGKLGLDELAVRRGSDGPLVALGKRFSRNFYASFERSLSGGLGTLYVFYEISRRVKIRAEAGEGSAVDLIFTFAWQ